MSELRQKFEELPDIKGIIQGSDFGFNESLNQYYHPDHTNHRLNYAFIMGAWCAFQSRQAEIDQLKAELALCREENKGLVESLNGEKALTTEALSQMRQKALILSEDCEGYKDPVQICQSEGGGWCVRFLETALQGGDQNTKNKAQSIENTGHEGGDQKALRGEHE